MINNDQHLDSSSFDPKKYISNFLKTNTIKDLIKKNNQIQEEIKIHDHEIQSLVFENYTKFISSIDTVKQMKNDISKVDSKLKTLDESMDKIANLAIKIDSTFSVKRKEIQKLDTINKDLKKLKNLCEFPQVLKADLQQFKSLEKLFSSNTTDDKPYESLFQNSVNCYRECFTTLNEFKTEPLIAPIYKQSISKVEQIRSMLWNLQSQFKPQKNNSKDLRGITKKYLTVTEEHITPLRTFFKKAKDKFSDNCLAMDKNTFSTIESQFSDEDVDITSLKVMNEATLRTATSADGAGKNRNIINETYWNDFEEDFRFVFEEIIPLTKPSEEIEQLLNNSCKQTFNFVMNNFLENVQKNWQSSLHFSILMDSVYGYFKRVIKSATTETLRKQFSNIVRDKFQSLCENHVNWAMTKLKTTVMDRIMLQKQKLAVIKPSDITQNDIFDLMNPIKTYILTNYHRVLIGLSNIKDREYFKDSRTFNNLIANQTQGYYKLIFYLLSTPLKKISEEVFLLLNSNHAKNLPTTKKQIEENLCKEILKLSDSGTSHIFNHSLLTIIHKTILRRVFDDWFNIYGLHSNTELVQAIEKQQFKNCIILAVKATATNLQNLCLHYVNQIDTTYMQQASAESSSFFTEVCKSIEQFIEVTGHLFPDNRRNIPKKPSFLNNSEKSYAYDTQIMIAKKTHIFDKKDNMNRPAVLSAFVKGVLKTILKRVRSSEYFENIENSNSEKVDQEFYCLAQMCYEITSVDEESLVVAFFHLIRQEHYRGEVSKLDKQSLDASFSAQRSKIKI